VEFQANWRTDVWGSGWLEAGMAFRPDAFGIAQISAPTRHPTTSLCRAYINPVALPTGYDPFWLKLYPLNVRLE
jgi:hypothetical protein